MMPHLVPIAALLAGIALLLLGTGLLNTVLALRGSLAGFSDQLLGLIASAYFFGFFAGTFLAPPLIRQMGHVRAFAFFAAAVAGCILLHSLWVDSTFWMLLRVVTGIALVGFYTVIESWLNSEAPSERRSQIFAVYMTVNLLALAAAQLFLQLDSPAEFTLFAVAAVFAVVALMPVVATRLTPPALAQVPRPALRRIWQAAPLAYVGALASGLGMGAFWGMGAVYAGRVGLDPEGVGMFITVTILAGAALQWPIGHMSDRMDRRRALALVAGAAVAAALLMAVLGAFGPLVLVAAAAFGGVAFAIYPLVVAHLIDHLPHDEILAGNAGILLLHGAGAAVGPALAGLFMGWFGPSAMPLFIALMFGPTATYALLAARRSSDEIVEEPAQCVPMLRTTPTVLEMVTPEAEAERPPAPTTGAGETRPAADSPFAGEHTRAQA